MKKTVKMLGFAVIIAFSFIFSSCAVFDNLQPYDETTETFDMKDFDKLAMGSAFRIYVKESSNYSVKITGDKKDLDNLVVKTVNGSLKIYYRTLLNFSHHRVDIEISMPALSEADFSGASTSDVSGFQKNEKMKISLSGASKGIFDVNAKNYSINVSGASTLEINGTPEKIMADISGASSLNAFSAKANEANIDVSGASNAKVDVTNTLKVDASGASSVRYRGNPKVDSNTSGASKVVKD